MSEFFTPEQMDGVLLSVILAGLTTLVCFGFYLLTQMREYRKFLKHQKAKAAWRDRICNDISRSLNG